MSWYAKNIGSWYQVINPYVKSGHVWHSINEGWVKDQGIWQRFYYRDFTAPTPPSVIITETGAGLQIEATVPSTSNAAQIDLRGEVIAGSITDQGLSFWQVQGVVPGETVTYLWELVPAPGTTYQVEARLLSNTGVSSVVTIETLSIPAAVNYYQAYIEAVASDSWVNGAWLAGDNLVIQGGPNNLHKGCWFYGNRLDKVMGNTVTKMEIQIRRIDSDHGVTGPANVRLAHHDNKTKPTFQPQMLDTVKVGELKRGERKWFTVPSTWYRAFKNSNSDYRGFGLYTTDLGSNSPNYIRTPGVGSEVLSGRIYVEYHD